VTDTLGRSAWSYHIEPDGSLAHGQPFYHLEVPDEMANGPLRSSADGLTFDSIGWLYTATNMGIQVSDQPGRVNAILRAPSNVSPSNVVFGGADLKTLYVTAGDKVYRRILRRTGVFPWQPVKLPRPQL
jgi:gluconolactonase